jgi:hypothetical protein|tara:strand:- start:155 stop:823 length:669 start_codon:yes stop_codon:yes gene_type:complete
MALSGTNAFNLDVDEVIQEAFERCGLHARSGYDLKSARRSLNLLLAEWANRGINLWTVELRTQTLTASTTSYTLDSDLIDILEAVVYKASDTTTDMEVDRISRAEYLNISKKSTEAVPTQYYLLRGQSTPTLYLYPTPDAADTFKYWGLTKIQDAGDYEDELDVPTRFLPCLTAGMAYYVSLKKSPERTPMLKQLYDEEWQRASEEDRPRSSFYAIPERGYI